MNRLWTSRNPQRQQMPYPRQRSGLPLALALVVGLAACGNGAQSAPVTDERAGQPAAPPPGAVAGATEPRGQELIVPPPDHARFDADLSSSAREQLQAFGTYERRVGGTEGHWEGRELELYVYTTDRPFEEVHSYYGDASQQLGRHGYGDIEQEPMGTTSPDQLQTMAEQHGFPQWYVEGYRELYPQLQGRTGRSAEFSIDDRHQTGVERSPHSYRDVQITVMQPFPDLRAGELHEQTVIQYVVMTMVRTDGR